MRSKYFSILLTAVFVLSTAFTALGQDWRQIPREERVQFHGKYARRQPFEVVEEYALDTTTRFARLSMPDATSAGHVSMIVPQRYFTQDEIAADGLYFYDLFRNLVGSKRLESNVLERISPITNEMAMVETPGIVQFISKYGNYACVRTTVKPLTGFGYNDPNTVDGIRKHEIFNSSGSKIWEEETPISPSKEIIPQYFISDFDGRFVRVWGNDVRFYDPGGGVVKDMTVFKNTSANVQGAAFSDDGRFFVLDISRSINRGEVWIIKYTVEGEELWRKEIGGGEYSTFVGVSPDGQYVFAGTNLIPATEQIDMRVFLLGNDGAVIWQNDGLRTYNRVFFSPESRHAVYKGRIGEHNWHIIELATGSTLFSFWDTYLAAAVVSDHNIVAFAKETGMAVTQLDGTPLTKQGFDTQKTAVPKNPIPTSRNAPPVMYTRREIDVRLSHDGEEVLVLANKYVYRFRRKR